MLVANWRIPGKRCPAPTGNYVVETGALHRVSLGPGRHRVPRHLLGVGVELPTPPAVEYPCAADYKVDGGTKEDGGVKLDGSTLMCLQ